jgi:iron complex outermembrane receptor protein
VWQAPTGTVRLSYRFTEDPRACWEYTRGRKACQFNATAPPRENGITVAKLETIDAFEIGLAVSWFQAVIEPEFSMFRHTYDNHQRFTIQTDFGTLPAFIVLNAQNAEVYGAELDLVAKP